MALHGNNAGGGEADRGQDVNPVQVLTDELQKAYTVAGEEMAKQMAAAVVAIVSKITAGQGSPGLSGWAAADCPDGVMQMIPEDIFRRAAWIVLVSPGVEVIPLFQGEPIWNGELTSGHRLLVLE